MSKQSYIGVAAILIVLVGLFFWISRPQTSNQTDNPNQPPAAADDVQYHINTQEVEQNWKTLLSAADGPARGNAKAPYTLIEIGDFQCPQCGRVRPFVESTLAGSDGKLKLYFINFPLQNLHPHALFAAEAALAASHQGHFWPMYDLLYEHQDELIPSEIEYFSSQEIPGFNEQQYLSDVSNPDLPKIIKAQYELVQSVGVNATPSFIFRKSSGGPAAWYVGLKDTKTSLGLATLAAAHPWLTGAPAPMIQSPEEPSTPQ